MKSWFLVFGWGSPIGIGIFLLCLSSMIYLLSKADTRKKNVPKKKKRRNKHTPYTHIRETDKITSPLVFC